MMECEQNNEKFRTLKVTPIIMENGLETKDTEKVCRSGMMVLFTRVNGITIKPAEKADSSMQMGTFTREAG